MQLKVSLVPDFSYSSRVHEFPVDIEISSDVPVEVFSPVDVSAALLTSTGGSGAEFGYIRRVTPANRKLVPLLPGRPLRVRIDVLEHEDDFEDYEAGPYRCDIKIEIGEKVGEELHSVELRESVEVVLA